MKCTCFDDSILQALNVVIHELHSILHRINRGEKAVCSVYVFARQALE